MEWISLCVLMFSAPVTVLAATRISDQRNPRNCLLQQKFYHAGTGECHHPLQLEGPCEEEDHWLMPSGESGLAECVPADHDLPEFCTPVLAGLKEVVCLEILEESLYKTTNCTNGQILLPENFNPDSRPCPGSWSCRANETILEELFSGKSVLEDSLEWSHLAGLECGEDKEICLPDSGQQSLLSTEVLVSSLQSARALCQPNPCPPSSWPWLGEDGYYGCYQADQEVQRCHQQSHLRLTEEGVLACGLFDTRSWSLTSGANGCRRNTVWINGRCLRLYG